MSSQYELRDLHARRVLVEMETGGKCVTVEGIGDYDCGELRISVQDPSGEFAVVMNDATWNGAITDAPDGNGFLVRLHRPTQN